MSRLIAPPWLNPPSTMRPASISVDEISAEIRELREETVSSMPLSSSAVLKPKDKMSNLGDYNYISVYAELNTGRTHQDGISMPMLAVTAFVGLRCSRFSLLKILSTIMYGLTRGEGPI